MLKANLRKFLSDAVVDPKDKKSLLRTIIEEGTPRMFELKAMELIEEAGRIRSRMDDSSRAGETLEELYEERMRSAATYLSLAVEKSKDGRIRSPGPDKTGSKDPGRTRKIPEGP